MDWFTVWLEIGVVTVFFALFGAAIWWCNRAKPIGALPYVWGTWIALVMAATSLYSMLAACVALSEKNMTLAVLWAVLAITEIVAAVGLFKRRKFGVIAFGLNYLLGLVLVIFLLIVNPSSIAATVPSQVLGLIGFIGSVVYFKKRWKWLSVAGDNYLPPIVNKPKSDPLTHMAEVP